MPDLPKRCSQDCAGSKRSGVCQKSKVTIDAIGAIQIGNREGCSGRAPQTKRFGGALRVQPDKHSNSFAERSLPMQLNKNLGMLLTGIWLILTGLIPLLSLSFSGLGTLMAILAIAAGALIVMGR